MGKNWSLEKELCKLTRSTSLAESLHKIKIIGTSNSQFEIREPEPWKRAGAETYIYPFWIKEFKKVEIGYILKACVAFSPGLDMDKILAKWIYRRKLLSDYGIATPTLYGYGNGVLLEELIPYKLSEILKDNYKKKYNILISLTHYSAVLEKLRFSSINPFVDLMSREDDVVVVDFGEDLGPPKLKAHKRKDIFNMMLDYLKNKLKISISQKMYSKLDKIFESKINISFKSIN